MELEKCKRTGCSVRGTKQKGCCDDVDVLLECSACGLKDGPYPLKGVDDIWQDEKRIRGIDK